MRSAFALLLSLSLMTPGCATICNTIGESVSNRRERPYPGLRFWGEILITEECTWDVRIVRWTLGTLVFLVDGPLCLVADTVILPYSLHRYEASAWKDELTFQAR